MIGAAERCEHGRVRVVLCAPMAGAVPFPTTFWLVCPRLMRDIGRAEALGGVAELERALADRPLELMRYHELHSRIRLAFFTDAEKLYLSTRKPRIYRALRMGGIGGMAYAYGDSSAKCLHLHTASMLALRTHPASSSLISMIGCLECAERCE